MDHVSDIRGISRGKGAWFSGTSADTSLYCLIVDASQLELLVHGALRSRLRTSAQANEWKPENQSIHGSGRGVQFASQLLMSP